eukprot:TRINITY_DN1658_c0_g1_i8.p1 TRINITY_DN1658_c0_g1~~TRINITY_DN1658_c0_g1_i8.p1  ORF type:complete len:195 (-),score=56.97 TRINITY_DN1658_c0_g1_i8:48-632(-)
MLRSLVGSEMCIRDRYQRRVRGRNRARIMAALPDAYINEGPDLDMELVFFPSEVPETISPICDGICLGSVGGTGDRHTLKKYNVTHVLTVASNCVPEKIYEDMRYKLFDLPDCPTYVIYSVFKEGLEFMREAIENKGTVFVHCGRGVSRSSTLVIAYLMHYENKICLLYTSDAADEEDSVDLGGRRIIKKKKKK